MADEVTVGISLMLSLACVALTIRMRRSATRTREIKREYAFLILLIDCLKKRLK